MRVCEPSTVTTAAGATAVTAEPSFLHFVTLTSDKTNDATCTIKDGAGGTTIWVGKCPGTDDARHFHFPTPVRVTNGVNVTTAGTGATSYVGTST